MENKSSWCKNVLEKWNRKHPSEKDEAHVLDFKMRLEDCDINEVTDFSSVLLFTISTKNKTTAR